MRIPGSKIFLTLDPGSGINIPDPQHCFVQEMLCVSQSNRSVFQNRNRVSRFLSVCSFNQAFLAPNNRKVNILQQLLAYSTISASVFCAGIFKQSMGARNRVGIGYTAWRNWFLGFFSWAPLSLKIQALMTK
jgi:hypothetical protein